MCICHTTREIRRIDLGLQVQMQNASASTVYVLFAPDHGGIKRFPVEGIWATQAALRNFQGHISGLLQNTHGQSEKSIFGAHPIGITRSGPSAVCCVRLVYHEGNHPTRPSAQRGPPTGVPGGLAPHPPRPSARPQLRISDCQSRMHNPPPSTHARASSASNLRLPKQDASIRQIVRQCVKP